MITRWQKISLLGVLLAAEVMYVWFTSVGFWTRWPSDTAYYDLLADGFLHRRTSLLVEPDPQLARLSDPYSMEARDGIPILWDLSYFNDRYFLYWGPTPAVLLVLPKLILGYPIADIYLVFAAVSAILVVSTLILVFLWKRFFADRIPFWLLLAGVSLVGFGLPMLWALSSANVYEAAVSTGMAFFLAGLYTALPTLVSEGVSRPRLALTGLFLALAAASRITLSPAILALSIVLVAHLVRRGRDRKASALDVACLLVPMATGGLLLGWYNFDRFGSPFETGYRFQLTGRGNTWQDVFDVRYLIPNSYNYLLRQFRTLSVFPFVKPLIGVEAVPLLPVNIHPSMYTTQLVSGILLAVPATFFVFFLGWWIICGETCPRTGSDESSLGHPFRFVMTVLLVLAALAFLPIGVYHWSENRFQMDFMPLVAIVSTAGAWVVAGRWASPAFARFWIRVAVAATFLASMVTPFLLSVSGEQLRFEKLNPELFEWITRLLA